MSEVFVIDCESGETSTVPVTPEQQAAHEQAQADAAEVAMSDQWARVDSVRGAQLRQTDYYVEPFTSDMPVGIQNAVKANEAAWLAFREGLRNITRTGDPAALVWPTLPPAPKVAITPPPAFVDWSAWGDNWHPAA